MKKKPRAFAVVDRFEGDVVVLEVDGQSQTRPRHWLDAAAREGDVVELSTGKPDRGETEKLRQRIRASQAAVHTKPGNFDL